MNGVSEIKCPHCKKWTLWRGHVDDRCLYCNEFLETERFPQEVEKKIRNEVRTESDIFFIKPSDKPFIRQTKGTLRFFRNTFSYIQIGFFTFMSVLLFILGMLAM